VSTRRSSIGSLLRGARTVAVGVVGVSVLAVGVAMLVLPGPAFVVIPAGLALLGVEFAWARRLLARFREHGGRMAERLREQVR
jgi:tellurite resistance protein TerC